MWCAAAQVKPSSAPFRCPDAQAPLADNARLLRRPAAAPARAPQDHRRTVSDRARPTRLRADRAAARRGQGARMDVKEGSDQDAQTHFGGLG